MGNDIRILSGDDMKCDFMNTEDLCGNIACDCGRPTRANLFFAQYPNAPHKNGVPLVFPCLVDKMGCGCNLSVHKPDFDDTHCRLCSGRYWLTKICNMSKG